MRVIGIDPGYDRMGVAIIEREGTIDTLRFSTCVVTDKKSDFPDRLRSIGDAFAELLKTHKPDILGIETLFFNKNVKTAIDVAQARGVIIHLAKAAGCEVVELSPQQVKVAVTGHGNSDKAAVTAMVKRWVTGAPEQAHDDEYDAIAVGITALAHHRSYDILA